MTDPDTQRAAIRDAMARLLDGAPIRSDGKLTIKTLADEAGVKRWVLTHRHTDLQEEFRARVDRHGQDPEPVARLKEQLEHLRQENTRLRQELRQDKATISLLQRHIAVDALEHIRQPPNPDGRGRLRPVPNDPDPDA
jgi:predicted RNase H-like nuclease (RuvC/YqgF family)